MHAKFTAEMIRNIREQFNMHKGNPETAILVHYECPADVVKEADFVGSTSGMIKYIKEHPKLKKVYLGTECEMTANLQAEFPNVEFVKTCMIFCQHMQKINLSKIVHCLEKEENEVTVPEEVRIRALKAIERMLAIN